MPVKDIKKDRGPVGPQVPPDQIPGYYAPGMMAQGQVITVPRPRQFDAAAVARGDVSAPPITQTAPDEDYLPVLPVYRWVSRFFPIDTLKDDDGQLEIGYWLTELETTAVRVAGFNAFYIPGGAMVVARIQESGGRAS